MAEKESLFVEVEGGEICLVASGSPQHVAVKSKKDAKVNNRAGYAVAVQLTDEGDVVIQLTSDSKAKITVTTV